MKITGQTETIFPTNIYIGEISQETHLATLAKLANIEWGKVPLTNKAHGMNVSKVKSEPTFDADLMSEFELDELHEELGHHLKAYCDSMSLPMNINARTSWVTRYQKGDYAVQHSHGSASISLAYYLASNGEDGNFYFSNYTPAKHCSMTEGLGNNHIIFPQERKIVLFPGWLEHGVHQNETDNVRCCLSANFYSV